jgi:hypothetical protein
MPTGRGICVWIPARPCGRPQGIEGDRDKPYNDRTACCHQRPAMAVDFLDATGFSSWHCVLTAPRACGGLGIAPPTGGTDWSQPQPVNVICLPVLPGGIPGSS